MTTKPENLITRASLLASWRAAERRAASTDALTLNHASAAGFLLHVLDEDILEALAVAEANAAREPWWRRVADYLSAARRGEDLAPEQHVGVGS